MAEVDMFMALKRLLGKGVRYSTVIDIGCADGHFILSLLARELMPDAVPVNVDANPLYETSLKSIAEVVGGHYLIGALTDYEGELQINTGAHHYWASARPADDPYWLGQHGVTGKKFTVPATTLDAFSRKLGLEPPFLLKLDVQGLEETVLRGGPQVLANTNIIICEAGIRDFHDINGCLAERDFMFYEATSFLRHGDQTLLQFYPIYVKKSLCDALIPTAGWSMQDQEAVVRFQETRRAAILKDNADFLARFKKPPAMSRNQTCSCGSGRKYKHCCGSHAGKAE